MITSLYASLIAFILIILSIRVIAARGNPAFKFFTFKSDDKFTLERVIRGHSNLIEYAPIFLILLYFFEIAKFDLFYVHAFELRFLSSTARLESDRNDVIDRRDWQENWVADLSQPGQLPAPPVAVEVVMEIAGLGEIRRTYVLPTS